MIDFGEAARSKALIPELSQVRSFFPRAPLLVIERSWRQVSDNKKQLGKGCFNIIGRSMFRVTGDVLEPSLPVTNFISASRIFRRTLSLSVDTTVEA